MVQAPILLHGNFVPVREDFQRVRIVAKTLNFVGNHDFPKLSAVIYATLTTAIRASLRRCDGHGESFRDGFAWDMSKWDFVRGE
jgi:hypothetical protein